MRRWRLKLWKLDHKFPGTVRKLDWQRDDVKKLRKSLLICYCSTKWNTMLPLSWTGHEKKFYADFINENGTDQGRLFRATEKLLAPIDDLCFSEYNDNSLLDNDIGRFFFLKTDKIRKGLDATDIEPNELRRLLPVDSAVENKLLGFHLLSQEDVFQLVQRSAKKMCPLDPMPTSMVVNCQDKLLSVITCMINSSLSSGYFSPGWKDAPVSPFRKKPGHYNSFQNLRPVSNLQLVSKLTERTVHNQIHSHMEDTEQFSLYPLLQSAIRTKS